MTGNQLQRLPFIPETVTVHLGAPDDESASNVSVSFVDYIKNVASSEIYPTWPESALRANILAQITFVLNRIYTEYYRSRGYDFDITNSTAIDQSFNYGRDYFENISTIVDEIFDTYIRREGSVEPLFALYCNGTTVTCDGLSQWGSVSLANQGLLPFEILQSYYGGDIGLVSDTPVQGAEESFSGRTIGEGSVGDDVKSIQIWLNRIAKNYPSIPKIRAVDGIFTDDTVAAVRRFQEIFSLPVTGQVDRAAWYAILRIYAGVKSLSDLNSEGITPEEVTDLFGNTLQTGNTGSSVRELQFFLNFISDFDPQVEAVTIDGIFGTETESSVRSFQRVYGIPETGIVEFTTWQAIYNTYQGILQSLPEDYFSDSTLPYPGFPIRIGSTGEEVERIQDYLNLISDTYTQIPKLDADGIFGPATQTAVLAYQNLFGIEPTGVVASPTYNSIAATYRTLLGGSQTNVGQYAGGLPSETA